MSDSEEETEAELEAKQSLSNSDVVTKYKEASGIINRALALVAAEVKPGAKLLDLCVKGDEYIMQEVGKLFNKKTDKGEKVEKGIAFPTCLSVNNCVCHFSPHMEDTTLLNEGDMVKIDMGCHLDGYVATAAHTCVALGAAAPAEGPAADVMQAAITAGEVALRLIKPGLSSAGVHEKLEKVAEAFGCHVVEGVLSHNLKRFVIDGNKVVLNKASPEMKAEDVTFEVNEVYAVDIVMSTGEGKPRVLDEKQTTVYKRALDKEYKLKMKASRAVFSDINNRFPTMPFAARALDQRQGRLGLVECLNHELLHPYPVLYERQGDLVAHFKATVLLMPNGSDRVTVQPACALNCEKKVEDAELVELLATPLKTKKKNKKKNKEAAAA